ncbi:MAG: hypothetical protein FJ087_16550, partial [Deltaproteobacteria bacterium]|nr:hypothetical protein [Deltaproteobacteria bacterium]
MSAKRSRRRDPEPARPAPPPSAPPSPAIRVAVTAAFSASLVASLLVPWGPFAYLPSVLSVPLVAAAVAAWWFALAADRAWLRVPERVLAGVLEAGGVALVIACWLLLKLVGLHPSGTDDNIYFYMAHRMTEGAMPYRDFFFAHPPVHLLVPAAVFAVTGGFSIGVAKAIPAVAQGAAGVLLYLALRRKSRPLAVLALLVHLTAYEVLMGSTDMNGENIMTAFLAGSLLAATRGRPLLAGALAGLGLGSGLYAFAAVLALGLASVASSLRAGARFGLGLLASFGGACVVFAAIGGGAFWDGVFAYHLAKPVKGTDRLPVFASPNPFAMISAIAHNLAEYLRSKPFDKSLYWHAPEWLAAALGLALIPGRAAAAWTREWWSPAPGGGERWWAGLTPRDLLAGGEEGAVKLAGLALGLFLLQWAALNEIYDFYTVPMLFFASIPAAWLLLRAWRAVRDAAAWRGAAFAAVLAGAFCLHPAWASRIADRMWPDETRAEAGEVVRYEWREPWALASLSGPTRALFFEDERVKGRVTPYYRHYVWNKMLTFSTVDDLGAHVAANTTPEETITGASTLAPLVALYAGRRMAGDEADTNNKRFSSGMLTDAAFWERACADKVRYVVSAGRSRFEADYMGSNPVTSADFRREHDVADPQLLHFRP